MKNSVKFKIHDLAYHRNGVLGNGFTVVLFSDNTRGRAVAQKKFMAVLFDEPGNIAVFNCARLSQSNIAFGENSWRAEDFEEELRALIKKVNEPSHACFFDEKLLKNLPLAFRRD